MRARTSSKVGDCCSRDVVTTERETPVVRCAQLMHDRHVGTVVLVENQGGRTVPVGMLTDRDIVIEVVAFGVDPSTLTAGDVMTADPVVANEDDDLLAVLARMREHGVRRLPVLDADGALAGLVSADDLWEVLAQELDGLVRLMWAERSRERATRSSASEEIGVPGRAPDQAEANSGA